MKNLYIYPFEKMSYKSMKLHKITLQQLMNVSFNTNMILIQITHLLKIKQHSPYLVFSLHKVGLYQSSCCMSQPHFWKSVRMKLTLSKWGLGSSLGLPKLQSSIAGVKTPCLGVFFIILESYRSADVENGLA